MLFSGFQTQAQNPGRIISLAPSLTKNLYLLDAGNLIVGCTNYCTVQAGTDADIVANAVQVNYEKIVVLQPDLVITTNLTKTRTINTFRKLGIKVKVFENPDSFKSICEQFIELGSLIGKEEKARSIIEEVDQRMISIKNSIPDKGFKKPRTFMQLGANPLFTVVPGTFMNDYINLSGTTNIAQDLEIGSINIESVLVRNPDVILIVLMGIAGDEEKNRWNSFSQLSAARDNRIFMLDADMACSPTPYSFVETLENIIKFIYPDS